MSKVTVIRTHRKFTMYREVERRRGRGAKFQWNTTSSFSIIHVNTSWPTRNKKFKTLLEAEQEWTFLILGA